MHRDITQAAGTSGLVFIGSRKSIRVLPSDILLEIFKVLCYDSKPDLSAVVPYQYCTALPGSSQRDDFLRITHVCHHWREEIISYSPFWRYIAAGELSLQRIAVYLERSRNLGLDVDVSCNPANFEKVQSSLIALSSLSHRIENILVRFTSHTTMDVLSPLFATKSGLSNIRSLRILSFPTRCELETFPTSLRHPTWPHLSKLQLCCSLPDISLLDTTNITELHLAWSPHEVGPTWAQFIRLIKSMPLLSILEVEQYTWSEMPLEVEKVELRMIERLRLSLNAISCRYFLACFDISKAKEIQITCEDYTSANSIILPSHVSEHKSFKKLEILKSTIKSSAGLISLSATLLRGDKEQNLSINLCLNTIRAVLFKEETESIIDIWRASDCFGNATYVTALADTDEDEDIDLHPIVLPKADQLLGVKQD